MSTTEALPELPKLPESNYKLGRQGGPVDAFSGNGYEPDWVLHEDAYTSDQMHAYARAALAAAAPSPAPAGGAEPVVAPEGWKLVLVNEGFGGLMDSLERAHRKGYMPDAITEDYEGFDYRDAAPTAQPQPADAEAVGTKPGYPQTSRDWLAAMVDIWEDGQKFESGEGCYVAGALGDSMREAKAHLSRTVPTAQPQPERYVSALDPALRAIKAQPEAPAEPSDNPERDEFYRVFNESTKLTGHQPTLYDVWLMARGRMDTSHRALATPTPVAQPPAPHPKSELATRCETALDSLEAMLGGRNGPSIQLRAWVRELSTVDGGPPTAVAQQPAELTDAARYRWLRDSSRWYIGPETIETDEAGGTHGWDNRNCGKLDQEVDVARAAIKAQGGSQ
jgi:hypothetical protein